MIRTKTIRRIGIVLVVVLFLTHSISPITWAEPTAVTTIHPNPTPLWVGYHQTGNLDVVIEDVQDLYGVEITAHFDPAVLQVVDADPDTPGIQIIPGVIPQPDSITRNTADNVLGTLEYVVNQINPTPPANGSGTFMTIRFRGMVEGGSSALVIDHVLFSDGHGVVIPVTPQNGQINIFPYNYSFPLMFR